VVDAAILRSLDLLVLVNDGLVEDVPEHFDEVRGTHQELGQRAREEVVRVQRQIASMLEPSPKLHPLSELDGWSSLDDGCRHRVKQFAVQTDRQNLHEVGRAYFGVRAGAVTLADDPVSDVVPHECVAACRARHRSGLPTMTAPERNRAFPTARGAVGRCRR
jgi:hypothetical protein